MPFARHCDHSMISWGCKPQMLAAPFFAHLESGFTPNITVFCLQ